MNKVEIWKPLCGFEETHEASSMGRIRRKCVIAKRMHNGKMLYQPLPNKLLSGPRLSKKGYARVNIFGRVYFVHRLIGATFVKNHKNKPQINHKNGIKVDNRATNLEWVTNQENRDHAVKTNLQARGERNNSKFTWIAVKMMRDMYKRGYRPFEIAKYFLHSNGWHIQRIIKNDLWSEKPVSRPGSI